MLAPTVLSGRRNPWNKGKLVGQKAPLKLRDIWAIRVRLELADRMRELALFNLAIDSKLRGCDLVQLRVLGRQMWGTSYSARKQIVFCFQCRVSNPSEHRFTGRLRDFELNRPLRFLLHDDRARGDAIAVSDPIRENCRGLGHRNRLGRRRLWNPYDAPDGSLPDLPENQEPTRGAAAVRP